MAQDEQSDCRGQRLWIADSATKNCMKCRVSFTFYRRRHHCRKCGEVACAKCTKAREVVPDIHPFEEQRVCQGCFEVGRCPKPRLSASATKRLTGESTSLVPAKIKDLSGPVPLSDEHIPVFGTLRVRVLEACGLVAAERNSLDKAYSCDAYCVLRLSDGPSVKTRTIVDTDKPRWNQRVSFLMGECDAVLHACVFNRDTLEGDDMIGHVELPLWSLQNSDDPFTGWVELTPLGGRSGKAGAIFLEIQLVDFQSLQHLLAFITPSGSRTSQVTSFDANAVYGPLVRIIDLLWTRLLHPVCVFVIDLLVWRRPVLSVLGVVLWNVLTAVLQHWPALFFACLVAYMLFQLCTKQATLDINTGSPKGALQHALVAATKNAASPVPAVAVNDRQRKVCSGVQILLGGLPSWVKELCINLSPLLGIIADALDAGRATLHWEHRASPYVLCSFMIFATLCEVCCFSTILKVVGSGTLLVYSPIITAVTGLLAYIQWMINSPTAPPCWRMRPLYLPLHLAR